jgi:hypothetical protein
MQPLLLQFKVSSLAKDLLAGFLAFTFFFGLLGVSTSLSLSLLEPSLSTAKATLESSSSSSLTTTAKVFTCFASVSPVAFEAVRFCQLY